LVAIGAVAGICANGCSNSNKGINPALRGSASSLSGQPGGDGTTASPVESSNALGSTPVSAPAKAPAVTATTLLPDYQTFSPTNPSVTEAPSTETAFTKTPTTKSPVFVLDGIRPQQTETMAPGGDSPGTDPSGTEAPVDGVSGGTSAPGDNPFFVDPNSGTVAPTVDSTFDSTQGVSFTATYVATIGSTSDTASNLDYPTPNPTFSFEKPSFLNDDGPVSSPGSYDYPTPNPTFSSFLNEDDGPVSSPGSFDYPTPFPFSYVAPDPSPGYVPYPSPDYIPDPTPFPTFSYIAPDPSPGYVPYPSPYYVPDPSPYYAPDPSPYSYPTPSSDWSTLHCPFYYYECPAECVNGCG
jgi:hypothetical protein